LDFPFPSWELALSLLIEFGYGMMMIITEAAITFHYYVLSMDLQHIGKRPTSVYLCH
jgi:hypothetical protein